MIKSEHHQIFYRVDERSFKEGDCITPINATQERAQDERQAVEGLLETCRPENRLSRKEALFVFDNLIDAIAFCSKWNNNTFIYEVTPEWDERIVKADMNILDIILKTNNVEEKLLWAQHYWDSAFYAGCNPVYEHLVPSAIVKRKLFSKQECCQILNDIDNTQRTIANSLLNFLRS